MTSALTWRSKNLQPERLGNCIGFFGGQGAVQIDPLGVPCNACRGQNTGARKIATERLKREVERLRRALAERERQIAEQAKQIAEKEKQITDLERQLALRQQNSTTTSKDRKS